MEQLILNIKDSSKLSFFMQLLQQFDFVEVVRPKKKKNTDNYNFFNSAGIWENRNIDAKDLREQAWKRQK